jgi:pyruvate-formate lyase
MSPKIG